jgi:hypothetical protein
VSADAGEYDEDLEEEAGPLDDELEGEEGTSLDTSLKGEDDVIEDLRFQPLDLNKATEEQLSDLPGIDRRIARRIVRERAIRKRFRSVDELRTVPGVTDEILEGIRALVKAESVGVRDAFFSGDTRFRMRNVNPRGGTFLGASPEFQRNTYFYNRTRLRFGSQTQVGWLAKRASVGPALTPENVQDKITLKESVRVTDAGPLDNIVLGNYTLSYGQGLVFYDGLGEFVRPAKVKGRGARPDFTSGSNSYFKGAAVEGRLGPLDTAAFVSQTELDLRLNPSNGTVDQDLDSLRQLLGDLQDEEALENNDTVNERLYGGRAAYRPLESMVVGVTGFEAHYSRVVDPTGSSFADAHVFRGDRSQVVGADFDAYYKSMNIFGEAARSRSTGPDVEKKTGTAWTLTPMFRLAPYYFWTSFFDYDADYFSRHAKGVSFAVVGAPEELTQNQRGVSSGFEYHGKRYKNRTNYTIASFPRPLGAGTGTDPVLPSQGRQLYFENAYTAARGLELYFRFQHREQDAHLDFGGGTRRQTVRETQKFRYQVTWRAAREVRYRVRYETRYEDTPELERRDNGYLVMGDVLYKPVRSLTLNLRGYYFDSPNANLSTGVEEIWNRVVYYRLAGAMNNLRGAPGTRFYLIAKQDIGPDLDVWFKYDVNHRPSSQTQPRNTLSALEDALFGGTRHGFHVQADYKWGGAARRIEAEEYRVLPDEWSEEQ